MNNLDNLVRLNKFIASNGYSSRRKVDELIEQGRVTVNGKMIIELGHKIDPSVDKVAVDGENIRTSVKKIYIMLNKPKGVVTTVSDDKHRNTVIDLINLNEKIFPVGRLDYNTSGLLLLTNDGELANKLMHPKSEIYKTYFVKLSKPLEEKHRLKLTGGINLEDKKTAPCKIRYPKKNNNYRDLYISIYEGRNRQVRKMFEFYGYFVDELKRTEYAGLNLGELKDGQWKKLDADEVKHLEKISASNGSDKSTSRYIPAAEKRDYKKYKARDDIAEKKKRMSKNAEKLNKFKKEKYSKTDKYEKPLPKGKKKISKWGTKDRLKTEKETKLGFKKVSRDDENYGDINGKKNFKKTDGRSSGKDNKKNYTKSGLKSQAKKPFKKNTKRSFKK